MPFSNDVAGSRFSALYTASYRLGSAAASAGAFAARRHWFGFGNYGPYENSKRRRARNWLRKRMPKSAYENMMRVKRTVLGPHDVTYED